MGVLRNIGLAIALVGWVVLAAQNANADYITVEFSGTHPGNNQLGLSATETFSGFYTFDDSVSTSPNGNWTYSVWAAAITDWGVSFDNAGYEFVGSGGTISLGNDTSFGDRYTVNLTGSSSIGNSLPTGITVQSFTMDLQDTVAQGQDMLSGETLGMVPIFGNTDGTANLLISGKYNDANGHIESYGYLGNLEASPVPEPTSIALLGLGMLGLAAWQRRRKQAHPYA